MIHRLRALWSWLWEPINHQTATGCLIPMREATLAELHTFTPDEYDSMRKNGMFITLE